MRTPVVCAGILSGALALFAANPRVADTGLTVHEWGTFTSVAGADGSAVRWNVLGCKDDLPSFVNTYGRNLKVSLGGTVRMETPVMYFYSDHEVDSDVKVFFPGGSITEWYPSAEHGTSVANQTGTVEWKGVKVQPGTQASFPVEVSPSRYYAARATDSAPLSVGNQREKFLFYRGVADIGVALTARVTEDGRIRVENAGGGSTVPTVVLFENRDGDIGYRNAGAVGSETTLDAPTLDASAAALHSELEAALMAQGLYPKEAAAMIDTWRDSWFEEGSRLIYILPQSDVDAILPLDINPAPSAVTRVFVGRIELITPETKRVVIEALAKNDTTVLARYRRFLDPILKSIGETKNFSTGCP